MIAMNNKDWQFGRCPICNAIVSLDHDRNVLCDACYVDRNQKTIVMPTPEDIGNSFTAENE